MVFKQVTRIAKSARRPEMLVRRAVWSLGVRYRLKRRGLPDAHARFYRAAYFDFVHGRFWRQQETRFPARHAYAHRRSAS